MIDILKLKKGSIKQAQLPEDSPGWDKINQMTWEEIESNANVNLIGFKAIRKLLSDCAAPRRSKYANCFFVQSPVLYILFI